jgi:NAD(P)-dependent dehydrogenase (short-subunit alcohol dehydrogenase family)
MSQTRRLAAILAADVAGYIASGQGLLPNTPNTTAYTASKGGVVNLTRALAAELAPSIRVNSVCPGLVDTPMTAGLERDVSRYALKRMADPMEIAQAILFLTSAESSFVTGAALAVDGGRTFH